MIDSDLAGLNVTSHLVAHSCTPLIIGTRYPKLQLSGYSAFVKICGAEILQFFQGVDLHLALNIVLLFFVPYYIWFFFF